MLSAAAAAAAALGMVAEEEEEATSVKSCSTRLGQTRRRGCTRRCTGDRVRRRVLTSLRSFSLPFSLLAAHTSGALALTVESGYMKHVDIATVLETFVETSLAAIGRQVEQLFARSLSSAHVERPRAERREPRLCPVHRQLGRLPRLPRLGLPARTVARKDRDRLVPLARVGAPRARVVDHARRVRLHRLRRPKRLGHARPGLGRRLHRSAFNCLSWRARDTLTDSQFECDRSPGVYFVKVKRRRHASSDTEQYKARIRRRTAAARPARQPRQRDRVRQQLQRRQ